MVSDGRATPVRTCVGCRRARPKAELLRIVKGLDGRPTVDRSATAQGRGAYVCSLECASRAGRRLLRALRGATVQVGEFLEDVRNAGVR